MEIKLVETEKELQQILDLQKQNHYQNVSEKSKETDGFVTVMHNLELLKKMNSAAPQIIAVDDHKVVGYALVMLKEFSSQVPVLMPMFKMFQTINYKQKCLDHQNYYVMGQVCVAEFHRGKGVFRALYKKHKEVYISKFDLCLTEVASSNTRSMRAHEKVGFKTIHNFKDETHDWNIMCWDWTLV